MKKINIKKAFALFLCVLTLSSCLKQDVMNIDTKNKTASIMTLHFIENGNGATLNSGMQYFSGAALTYPGSDIMDTATYNINLAGPVTLANDLKVTVGADATKLLDNYSTDSIKYELMPDSLYHLVASTATIKSGSRLAVMKIVFYPSKINVTKSYMLPLVIKDASGQIISSNMGTIYFHVIGNPIAGAYTQEWIRYNLATQTGTPAYDRFYQAVFAPVNPNTIMVGSGAAGLQYVVTFNSANGVLSNFQVKFTPESVAASGVTISGGPTVVVANPASHKYEFNFTYINGAGSPRNITDKFY